MLRPARGFAPEIGGETIPANREALLVRVLESLPGDWRLTLTHRKKPYRPDWRSETLDRQSIVRALRFGDQIKGENGKYKVHPDGLALIVPPGHVAVDVDGKAALALRGKLQNGIQDALTVSWTSGKEGRATALYRIPVALAERIQALHRPIRQVKIDDKIKHYGQAIELKLAGQSVTIPPSNHPDTTGYRWLKMGGQELSPWNLQVAEAPQWVIQQIESEVSNREQIKPVSIERAQFWQELDPGSLDELIQQALDQIDPDCHREDWFKVLCALNSVDRRELAEEWSARGAKYDARSFDKTWDSIESRDGGYTLATLLWLAGIRPSAKGHGLNPSEEPEEYRDIVAQQQEQERCEAAEAEHLEDAVFIERLRGLKRKKRQQRQRVEPIKSSAEIVCFDSPEQQNALIEAQIKAGKRYIQVASETGAGKTYYAGLLTPEALEVKKLLYVSKESRNPATRTIEANFEEMPVRNMGLEPSGKTTPLGNPAMRPVPFERATRDAGNCHRTDLFVKFKRLGYDTDSAAGSNPICATCPFNIPRPGEDKSECAAHSGPGYGFRYERSQAFLVDRIRMHVNSAPETLDSSTIAIFEEAGEMPNSERVEALASELDTEWAEVEQFDPEIFSQLSGVRRALRLAMADSTRYGLTAEVLRDRFDPIGNAGEILDRLRPVSKRSLGDLFGRKPKEESLPQRAKRAKRAFERQFKAASKQNQKVAELAEVVAEKPTEYRERKLAVAVAKLEADREKLERAARSNFELEELAQTKRAVKPQKVDAQKLLETARPQKLWDLLAILLEVQPGAVRVLSGKVEITKPDGRLGKLAQSAKAAIFLDATCPPEILASNLGIEVSEIVVIKLRRKEVDNLHHVQVSGFGKCGRDRADSTNQRLARLHDGIRRDAAKRLGIDSVEVEIADFKGVKEFDARIRHLSNSRGSNEIEGTQVLIVHGLPKPNLGAVQDEYACQDRGGITFEQFYQHKCDAEIIQLAGRLRSNNYPDRQFLIYWVSEEPLPFEAEQVEAGDLSAEAASPGERAWRTVKKLAIQTCREGILPNLDELAAVIGKTKAYLSQLAKKFEGGWKAFKQALLPLVKPPKPDESELTEIEQLAVVMVEEIATVEDRSQVASDLAALVEPLGWASWCRIASKLAEEVRFTILDKLFGVEAGTA